MRNALKFSVGGMVRLIVAYDEDLERLRVHVQDNGLGISPEDQGKIFELDMKAHSGDQLNRDGLGMGLAICKGIVTRLGGSIEVFSEGLRRGSTFTFCVEMKQPPVSAIDVSLDQIEAELDQEEAQRPAAAEEESKEAVPFTAFGLGQTQGLDQSAYGSTDLEK